MQNRAVIFIAVISTLFLCAFGGELTDNDARKLITEYLGFPKPVMTIIHAGPATSSDIQRFKKGIDKLVREGYLKNAPRSAGGDKYYEPTFKSGKYVAGAYIKQSFPYFEGAVCSEVVKKIDDIRFDKQSKVAVISFTLGFEPVEPFYSAFCINKYCDCFGPKLKKTEKQKLKVKKSERGWAITG